MPISLSRSLRTAVVVLLSATVIGGLLSGCLKKDETPDAETHAAVKTINNAKAEQSDADQRAKEVNDMTSTGH